MNEIKTKIFFGRVSLTIFPKAPPVFIDKTRRIHYHTHSTRRAVQCVKAGQSALGQAASPFKIIRNGRERIKWIF